MSISVNSVGRITSQPAQTPASDNGGGGSAAAAERVSTNPYSLIEFDSATNQPKPPRFPWLSRLTAELEPSAKQKPPFPSAPPLGENVDQAA